VIFDGRQQVARHDRLTGRLEAHLELDHYLEALIRKPGRCPHQSDPNGGGCYDPNSRLCRHCAVPSCATGPRQLWRPPPARVWALGPDGW
jgi:hypothetical protein